MEPSPPQATAPKTRESRRPKATIAKTSWSIFFDDIKCTHSHSCLMIMVTGNLDKMSIIEVVWSCQLNGHLTNKKINTEKHQKTVRQSWQLKMSKARWQSWQLKMRKIERQSRQLKMMSTHPKAEAEKITHISKGSDPGIRPERNIYIALVNTSLPSQYLFIRYTLSDCQFCCIWRLCVFRHYFEF